MSKPHQLSPEQISEIETAIRDLRSACWAEALHYAGYCAESIELAISRLDAGYEYADSLEPDDQ